MEVVIVWLSMGVVLSEFDDETDNSGVGGLKFR
jgi:hypothetical protein